MNLEPSPCLLVAAGGAAHLHAFKRADLQPDFGGSDPGSVPEFRAILKEDPGGG